MLAISLLWAAWPAFAAELALPGLVVTFQAEPALAQRAAQALQASGLPVSVRVETLPRAQVAPTPTEAIHERLGRARQAYVNARFRDCLELLNEDQVLPLLVSAERELVARLLFWRTACFLGSGDAPKAERSARTLAVLGLDAPSDVERATPEVESLVARLHKEVGAAAPGELRVTTRRPGATFWIDGRVAPCSEPCNIRLPEGAHVVRVEEDGYAPRAQWVDAHREAADTVMELTRASPAEASEQWATRYAAGDIGSAGSVRLLSIAFAAPRLVAMRLTATARGVELSGALGVDGDVKTRGERQAGSPDDVTSEAPALLRDLLILGKVLEPKTPLYKSGWFWGSVVGACLIGGVVAAIFYHPPPVQTSISVGKQ